MPVVREADLAVALKRRSPTPAGLLVFGADEARVSAVVDQCVTLLARAEDVRRLQAASLRSDPSELDTAMRSQSLLGDRQVIVLEGASDTATKFIEPFLPQGGGLNFLVVTSGALGKTSTLRSACEGTANFLVVALYDDKPADILEAVCEKLRRDGFAFAEDASERFMALCGTNRIFALNEAEKLALYCFSTKGSDRFISADDIAACCGDQASYGLDAIVDAVLAGDSLAADRMLQVADESDLRGLLPVFSSHLARLSQLRQEVDRLGGIESALRSAKPPVFFGRKAAFSQQLKNFNLDTLVRFQSAIESAVEQTRRHSAILPSLISRLAMSLSTEARRSSRSEVL